MRNNNFGINLIDICIGKSDALHCAVQTVGILQDFYSFAIGSFTGSASFLIGGQTLHSMLSLPLVDEDKPFPPYDKLWGPKLRRLQAFWFRVNYLFLDEISMVSSDMLSWVDQRLRDLKDASKPFGGVNVIAFGDFYQLPPVGSGRPVYEKGQTFGGGFNPWTRYFMQVELTENYRALGDKQYTEFLARVRTFAY